jgi:hypothetical protein
LCVFFINLIKFIISKSKNDNYFGTKAWTNIYIRRRRFLNSAVHVTHRVAGWLGRLHRRCGVPRSHAGVVAIDAVDRSMEAAKELWLDLTAEYS